VALAMGTVREVDRDCERIEIANGCRSAIIGTETRRGAKPMRRQTINWRLLRLRTQRNFDGGQSDADCLTPQLHQRPSRGGKTNATNPQSVAAFQRTPLMAQKEEVLPQHITGVCQSRGVDEICCTTEQYA
jgi:hypothetical protein